MDGFASPQLPPGDGGPDDERLSDAAGADFARPLAPGSLGPFNSTIAGPAGREERILAEAPLPSTEIDSAAGAPRTRLVVAVRPVIAALVVGTSGAWLLAGFVLLAFQRDTRGEDRDELELDGRQRALLVAIFGLGFLGVFTGWYVSCLESFPAVNPSPRLFLPLLPALVVAFAPARGRWGALAGARVPPAVLLAPFYAVYVVDLAGRMR